MSVRHPQADTPGRHPLAVPSGRHPQQTTLGKHPQANTPWAYTPSQRQKSPTPEADSPPPSLGRHPPWTDTPTSTWQTVTAADSTHPTRMHSSLKTTIRSNNIGTANCPLLLINIVRCSTNTGSSPR